MKLQPKHNPDCYSAVRRREREKELSCGTVKCDKCGATSKTLYKVAEDPATYVCVDCLKVDNA